MSNKRNAEVIALVKTEQRKVSKETKKLKKAIEEGKITVKERKRGKVLKNAGRRGLIYIGHIPHGFYEVEMKDYFKQFGVVTNVKVCRSRRTGNSKGFGYVEFANSEVAKIAADTMNNYVMFKKRIVSEFVPVEKRPKGLFLGKSSTKINTSVKTRRGKEKHSKNKIVDDKTVIKKQKKVLGKLTAKIERLNQLGIKCTTRPVGVDSKLLEELEVKSKKQEVEADEDSEVEFRKPSARSRSQTLLANSKKSLSNYKSSKTVLTKSLDSVKKLLSKKKLSDLKSEGTQTTRSQKKTKTKGGAIVKKEKKPVALKKETVKIIARELIRKRGNPLINLLPSKSSKISKKK